jgi:DNA-directed RNA polymerase delta subunit
MAKKLKKEELELMSYNDIAYLLLKDKPKQSTLDLFSKIVEMLELPKKTLENKIGDFYTALTKDKNFILLDDGSWDLQANYKVNKAQEEDEDDFEEEIEEYDDEEIEKEDEMFDNENSDDDIADITEEYKNLVIVDEDELDQE